MKPVHCPGYSNEFDPTEMYRRILVPIDFSPESRRALITACETRKRFGSEIHAFVETNAGSTSGLRGLGVGWGADGARSDAHDMLGYFAESICAGMPCLANHVTYGEDIVAGIAAAARQCDATMVIMGIHKKHTLWRSRAEKILQALDLPVMVLQPVEEPALAPLG